MSKGDETRQRVIEKTGKLLNRTGYFSTSMSSILTEVGLKKGGLYNHFLSKEELALEAFKSNVTCVGSYLKNIAEEPDDPLDVLFSLCDASLDIASGRILPGGCPILNAGIESDFISDNLKTEASLAMEKMRKLILIPLRRLEEEGRLKAGTDVKSMAFFILAAVEGSILVSKISEDKSAQQQVIENLKKSIDSYMM